MAVAEAQHFRVLDQERPGLLGQARAGSAPDAVRTMVTQGRLQSIQRQANLGSAR
jgi:hypothetical protein